MVSLSKRVPLQTEVVNYHLSYCTYSHPSSIEECETLVKNWLRRFLDEKCRRKNQSMSSLLGEQTVRGPSRFEVELIRFCTQISNSKLLKYRSIWLNMIFEYVYLRENWDASTQTEKEKQLESSWGKNYFPFLTHWSDRERCCMHDACYNSWQNKNLAHLG